MRRYKSIYNKPLRECVIVGGHFNKENTILAKNRDRTYSPNLVIKHRIFHEVEIAYMKDDDTGWVEGMNEYGIGIVNSSLLVDHDEKEKEIVRATGKKSQDAPRIIKALTYTSIDDVVHSVAYWDTGVKGHTICANKHKVYLVECTGRHDPVITELKKEDIVVRTNHGYFYQDIGYQHGEKFLSSKLRKSTIENSIDGTETALTMLDKLNNQENENKFLNPLRDDKKMHTTSQIAYDLFDLKFYFREVKGKCKFKGVKDLLPKGYEPKIKIEILDPVEISDEEI